MRVMIIVILLRMPVRIAVITTKMVMIMIRNLA